ncbi:MAG: hypothetical protein H0X67_15760 [Acidobacteria bacterium]|nr:hypothetical protein [Acidobacteriota bacterium]
MLTCATTVLLVGALLQAPQPSAPPAGTQQGMASAPQPAAEQPPAEQPPALDPEDLPFSLGRIQKAMARPSTVRLELDRPVFRTEVIGRKPTIEDILGPDFARGAASHGGMTHQEFLNMVTPKDVQGYAAFSNGEALTVAATSFVMQWALQRAVQRFEDANTEREREAARREVEEALRDLDRARQKAGLPQR